MFRIKDIEPLAQEANFEYGIQYWDENGNAIVLEDDTFIEDVHREVLRIFILDDYTEEGLPRIVYNVKYNSDEDIHYDPELIIPVTLKDFFSVLDTTSETSITFTADVPLDSDTFILAFELIPDPDRIRSPKIEVKTSDTVIQIKLPESFN